VRALYFHSGDTELGDPGFPFSAVQVLPGSGLTVDLWACLPK
jgi:hypothetical protein